jgi:octaprenyl-diphosphate synthase
MKSDVVPLTLEEIQAPVCGELDAVFDEIAAVVKADLHLINEVSEHLLRIKGKLFRPTLLLLSAQAVGKITHREITLGAVVELIHLATLLHDDSVDHSAMRRGQPTVNAEFSHEVAVIMGDYLYSRAIEQLVKLESQAALEIMSRVTNELTVGEMREVVSYDGLDLSEADYESLILAKTASLMAGACELGALAGGHEWREPLRRYGTDLGAAFQIADDMLDYSASSDVTGKPVGQDLREHKVTLPLIAVLPLLNVDERSLLERLMADPAPDDAEISDVIAIVDCRGGVLAARERALGLAQRAEAELEVLPPGVAREALRASITYCVERSR